MTKADASIYAKYGGFATVSAVVIEFYRKVSSSPTLEQYFKNVDMEALLDHQTKFMCQVLGGPANYTGRNLKMAHAKLKITRDAFDEVAGHLKQTLEEGGVEPADVETVIGIVGSVASDIITVDPAASTSS
jgi:hemoglobin